VHRDQKIGLSLAVLLIGFAAAFCFRHEDIASPQRLALAKADELDLRIEHLPIRAYTEREGVRLPGERDTDRRPVAASGPLSDVMESHLSVSAGHSGDTTDDGNVIDLFAGPPEPLRVAAAPPQPAPARPTPTPERSPLERLGTVETWQGADGGDTAPVSRDEPTVTYVVRSGDTLSELAQRFLGSTARYRELFEANRDVLANPDVLPAGTILQVPADAK